MPSVRELIGRVVSLPIKRFGPPGAFLSLGPADNEVILLPGPEIPEGRTRWLTPAEALRLEEAASWHLKPPIRFLLCTGARLSEAEINPLFVMPEGEGVAAADGLAVIV